MYVLVAHLQNIPINFSDAKTLFLQLQKRRLWPLWSLLLGQRTTAKVQQMLCPDSTSRSSELEWWEKNGSMSNRRSGRRIEPQVRSVFASSNRKSPSHTSGIKTNVNSRRTCKTLCFYPGDSTSEFRTVTFSFEPLPQSLFFMLALGCVCAL